MRKLLLILSALVAATYANAAFWLIGSGSVDSVARLAIESHKADLNNPHQTATDGGADIGAWAPTGSVHYADGAGRLLSPDGNIVFKVDDDGNVVVSRIYNDTNRVYIVSASPDFNGPAVGFVFTRSYEFPEVTWWTNGAWMVTDYTVGGFILENNPPGEYDWEANGASGLLGLPAVFDLTAFASLGSCVIDWGKVTNSYALVDSSASGDLVSMTNWQAIVYSLTNGAALGATALQPSWAATGTVFRATEVIGAQSTLIETAWQNPANAVDWTWTSNGREITLTGYTGPNAVVIPDMLDGLPVTGFGEVFRGNMDITSVGGGANIKEVGDAAFFACGALNSVSLPDCTTVGDYAFFGCEALNSVSLPACTTVGDAAFSDCISLSSVSLPACTTVGNSAFAACRALNSVFLPACTTVDDYAFSECGNLSSVSLPDCTTVNDYAFSGGVALNSVSLPACTTVGDDAFSGCFALNSVSLPACTTVNDYAFSGCFALNSVTFGQNAPAPATGVFEYSTPTIYVSNPHATGWGDTWNGRPVVRAASMSDIASHNTDGTAHADIRALIPALPDNPNIYTPVYTATTTIAVNPTQAVYKATFGTDGTVTQSIAGLTVSDTQEARWELWLNATNPAALSPTWQGNLDWQGGTPELTVTGLYKFAMSTTGTRITGRQTYPTVYAFEQIDCSSPVNATELRYAAAAGFTMARFTASGSAGVTHFVVKRKYLEPMIYQYPCAGAFTNGTVIKIYSSGYYYVGDLIQTDSVVTGTRTKKVAVVTVPSGSSHAVLTFSYLSDPTANYLVDLSCRKMNELEIAAYNAGWRP